MQETFQRVLVTTDFSEFADHAIAHAFRIAADHGAEVILCHVVESAPLPNPLYAHYSATDALRPEARKKKQDEARHALRDRVPKVGPLAAVQHREVVVEGDPAAHIVAVAERERADLLVISTHGRTGMKRLVLGSVAERVIRQSPHPVLVVR